MATRTAAPAPASTDPRRRRTGRRIVVALAVLVVVLAALFGAAGYYFAGQIDSEALAVAQPGPTSYDLVVGSAPAGQVALRRTGAPEDHDPLQSADRYGLLWPGGSGIVSGGPEQSGPDTIRTLQVLTGTAPAPGTPATLNRDVWTDPALATGTPVQDVSYPCAGGSCPAWFVPGTSSTWMVLVHGKGATRDEPLRAMVPAVRAGLPALDIDYRNDRGAPADPSGHYGYGTTEWRDLDQAVQYAVGHGARSVVLYGSSMGGSIVASFLEHSPRASLVRGVVLDAPALDLRSSVELGASQRRLPLIGTPLPGVLTDTAEWIAGWRYGVDWDAMDYLPGSWLHVPALVFHGTADPTVPIATSDRFRAAHPDLVREVRVPGATHVESWNADPARYTSEETAFLTRVTGR